MNTFRLTVAYDGTNYFGWQAQTKRPTVQAALEDAVEQVTGQKIRLLSSGRTDAGVHALGQVVRLRVETRLGPEELLGALNAVLPPDVAVRDVRAADEAFHPIRHALRKRYRYLILNGPVRDVLLRHYCWHYNKGLLDAEAMHRAAQSLRGKHDFSSFETAGAPRKSSVRTISDIFVRRMNEGRAGGQGGMFGELFLASSPDDWIIFEVEADGFLYNMVRAIVGTLVEVGRGARPEGWIAEVLDSQNRRNAGPNAPPQGLFLVRVEYPGE
ncbi:MAG: tRNA pseudouridine(38-40) synthase TruA [Pirellulales bacterium]|nr:tRNA pseudouridine(38-40) synthase TruA [Pirellulales bacterium]